MQRTAIGKARNAGFNLLEILAGIAIFALGMMALAQLQGSLARTSGDSNAKSVAVNLAEETMESMRSFARPSEFTAIVSGTDPAADIGGIEYTVSREVTDYYYQVDTDDFGTERPTGFVNPAMKLVELSVTWDAGPGMESMGSGEIKLVDMISSIPTLASGKVVLNATTTQLYAPPVDYNPGENPDIIAIQLGTNKFKESTTPLPDVIRQNELVETRFDVVTYSQDSAGAVFLRREEFRGVSCQCSLHTATASDHGGLRPTVWDGSSYTEGEFVAKTFGRSTNNRQSVMCDVCCRDHHDGGTGEHDDAQDPGRARTNPFRSPSAYRAESERFAGDHTHYNRNSSGNLTAVTSEGGAYVEACRLIRKDGFFRVAQDLRQEGLFSFPADYLDDDSEITEYSGYVTEAITAYETDVGTANGYEDPADVYEDLPPVLTAPEDMDPSLTFPASTPLEATTLPTAAGATTQQLRSRGIYLDYLTDTLRAVVDCFDLGGDGATCGAPEATTKLEVIPFFDVQLTWLARWNEEPVNNPIDVTNEAIADQNEHSRGVAQLNSGADFVVVDTTVHSGNLGLTGTDPVDPNYASELESYDLHIVANGGGTPPPVGSIKVSGTITSSVPGLHASDVEILPNDAECDRTNPGYTCYVLEGASSPTLKVFNYSKASRTLVACSEVLEIQGADTGSNPWTRFHLPTVTTPGANIVIREASSCG